MPEPKWIDLLKEAIVPALKNAKIPITNHTVDAVLIGAQLGHELFRELINQSIMDAGGDPSMPIDMVRAGKFAKFWKMIEEEDPTQTKLS